MRFSLISLLTLSLFAASITDAHALRSSRRAHDRQVRVTGCSTVRALGSDVYKNSKPHRACSAINCAIDYFERFPSLLVNTRGTPRKGAAVLINSNGKSLMSCAQLPCRDCRTGARYVCRGNTNAIAKRAKSTAGSYTVFYKLGSYCVRIPDVGRCVGSVKGLCNQVLH